MPPPPALVDLHAAARRLGDHPQDHGWRELYKLFALGLADRRAPHLCDVLTTAHTGRPHTSLVHLLTMLGIAVRHYGGETLSRQLVGGDPPAHRLSLLERLLVAHRSDLDHLLGQRQNSFTGVRRFLVPQVLLGAYFTAHGEPVRFADLGTGLGILPRQLNSRTLFDRYHRDLTWPEGRPVFQPVPLAARHGVDRGPLPDLAWVRACYGPSEYYRRQFQALVDALAVPEVAAAEVRLSELDLLDLAALRRFIHTHQINAVNLCYTLYELAPAWRAAVIETLRRALPAPGLIIVIEPRQELTRPGCTVTVYDQAARASWAVCQVSDGHFRGEVVALAGFDEFLRRYPVKFTPVEGEPAPTAGGGRPEWDGRPEGDG